MYGIKFDKNFISTEFITEPTEEMMLQLSERTGNYESDCNGLDPFFVFNGVMYSIEHDCFKVDELSRLNQPIECFRKADYWFTNVEDGLNYAIFGDFRASKDIFITRIYDANT